MPTVGRIVHYTNLGDAEGKFPPETQAALITKASQRAGFAGGGDPDQIARLNEAEDNFAVSLNIFYETGNFYMKDVPFSHVPGERGHWNWPPR